MWTFVPLNDEGTTGHCLQTDQRASLCLGQMPRLRSAPHGRGWTSCGLVSCCAVTDQVNSVWPRLLLSKMGCLAWDRRATPLSHLESGLCVTGALNGLRQEAPRWASCSSRRPASWEERLPAAGSWGRLAHFPAAEGRAQLAGLSRLCLMSESGAGARVRVWGG